MTYCLAMRLAEGLVFLSDTRTNAGLDNISTFRKLHVLQPAHDRVFVLQSAGNLATTHELLDRIDEDLRRGEDARSLATVETLGEAALYVGGLARDITASHRDELGAAGAVTLLLGGQVAGHHADSLLVYPEGNYIRASEDLPYLQIGESKYGKFLLDLGVTPQTPLALAIRVAVASMMSTARANLSVGPPYDLGVYVPGSYVVRQRRIEANSDLLSGLEQLWERHLRLTLEEMPQIEIDFDDLV
jgi:putative proteasome-type protease